MASSKKPRPGDLTAVLEAFLKDTISPGQRLLLGFSGGLDSGVLLHLLAGLRQRCDFKLSALHVNHGISPNADAWQDFCAATCAHYGVHFTAQRVDVPRDAGLGLEAAARAARYAVLQAQPVDLVVLAHHQDDQAETLLLQLLRGAGVKGMAGMSRQRSADSAQSKMRLLRPLLDVSRAVLEGYAQAHQLNWIEDETNLELAYDRNFMRQQILPALAQRYPAARITLARSASHLAEAASLLDEMAEADACLWVHGGRLDIAGLHGMSDARAKNLLRHWLSSYGAELPSTRRLQDIYRQLLEARIDASVAIKFADGLVHRYRNEAWFEHAQLDARPATLVWQGEDSLILPSGNLMFKAVTGTGIKRARLADEPLTIGTRSGGERLRLKSGGPSRTLKNLFQEAAIPSWQRQAWPLIYWREQLIFVPAIGVAEDWQAGADEAGLCIVWQQNLAAKTA